jgi:hypothetical protein
MTDSIKNPDPMGSSGAGKPSSVTQRDSSSVQNSVPGNPNTNPNTATTLVQKSTSIADQAVAASHDLRDKATNLAGSSAEAVKSQASDLVDAAKDIASKAGEKIQDKVNMQKGVGAEYVGKLADAMRRAAREFETDVPFAATYIRKAASQVEGVSDSVRDGNLNDLIRGAQAFAKRQPTVFLGLAVLAGFGVVRFLKSSAAAQDASAASFEGHDRSSSFQGSSSYSSALNQGNRGFRDDFSK